MHDSAITLAASSHQFPLLTTIAAGFAAAWVLGLMTHRLGLSPIVGYLLAGVVIGPHTPGFTGDVDIAHQLAEVGVILLMFGVGLHFHLKDLLAVRSVAVPGAIVQSTAATAVTIAIFHYLLGWPFRSVVVLGMAMSVASTVVLLRVLMDRRMLHTSHGHVAVGWLIVEDIFTVLALVLVPMFALPTAAQDAAPQDGLGIAATVGWALLKLGALVVIVLLAGSKVVPWVLNRVAALRSPELFTLTVLVLSVAIAVGAAAFFGASVALGAFLAGMVVAQSPVSHQAAADALPMRDAFSVLFFVSVGMLFDPSFLVEQPWMAAAGLGIVLVAKPIAALVVVAIRGYPVRTALTVALGLAQIGEFSFILAQVGSQYGLMPEEGTNTLIATAMITITLNPLLFNALDRIEAGVAAWPWLWRLLNARHARRVARINARGVPPAAPADTRPLTIIIGYGPVGRLVDALLRDAAIRTVILDMNIDTVQGLTRAGRSAIYGDATRRDVLIEAGIRQAAHLVITLPHGEGRAALVMTARELNPEVEVTVRAHYLTEQEVLRRAGATTVIVEEGEAGIELARRVLESRGVEGPKVNKILSGVRTLWKLKD